MTSETDLLSTLRQSVLRQLDAAEKLFLLSASLAREAEKVPDMACQRELEKTAENIFQLASQIARSAGDAGNALAQAVMRS